MPPLSELRSRLARAQTKATTARLSSSQCIDLLLKVCQKRNITLVPTLNGEELLTLKQLELDVENAVEARGGRTAVSELAAALGVQQNYVDRTVEKLLREHPERYTRLQDTLITTSYTDWLMETASVRLRECGVLNVCDFASEFELPFDLLKLLVTQSRAIEGRLNGTLLESRGYEACKERCVAAALAATTVPTSTLHLSAVVRLDVNLVNDVVARLVKAGKTRGTLKGGVYTPKVFSDHRHASLTAFYSANGYIERSKVADVLKKSKDDASRLFPNSMTLDTVIINRNALEPVSVLVKEAIASAGWRDVGVMLPAALAASDIAVLLEQINNAAKNGFIVAGLYLSTAFAGSLVKHVVDTLKERLGPKELLDTAARTPAKLREEVEALLESDPDSAFAECWSIASAELYERVEPELLSLIRQSCVVEAAPDARRAVDVEALSERLKEHHMKFDSTLKVMEKLGGGEVDGSHLIMKTLVKELLPADCHTLLQLYATQNFVEIPGEAAEVGPSNRAAVVEAIKDKEIKADFGAFLEALKQKDALKAIEASRALKAALYISCNAKKERKRFLKTQAVHYEQQLASLGAGDELRAAHCALTLALVRGGHYAFLVDKDWCLRGCVDGLAELVGDPGVMDARARVVARDVLRQLRAHQRGGHVRGLHGAALALQQLGQQLVVLQPVQVCLRDGVPLAVCDYEVRDLDELLAVGPPGHLRQQVGPDEEVEVVVGIRRLVVPHREVAVDAVAQLDFVVTDFDVYVERGKVAGDDSALLQPRLVAGLELLVGAPSARQHPDVAEELRLDALAEHEDVGRRDGIEGPGEEQHLFQHFLRRCARLRLIFGGSACSAASCRWWSRRLQPSAFADGVLASASRAGGPGGASVWSGVLQFLGASRRASRLLFGAWAAIGCFAEGRCHGSGELTGGLETVCL
ncbi:E3 UFM1-protein ligase 1, putative [Babesia caballi]|uniref:E3 UFM1-protein ligase 1, putative n=1 Tax=Babesia caballi TaxID=5871 RepID=A0AAV4LNQ0_BABCB|nr:E3 UFM1-protein ligase 1, putative [Babesia caballi]